MTTDSTLNWDDLRIVSAVCATASYARAARLLHMNETTVSRRVARLESLLGLALFEAVDGQRQPTDACRAVTMDLRSIAGAIDEVGRKLRDADHNSRRFRLTTISAIAQHYLAPNLPQLFERSPTLMMCIDTSDQNADMSRWEADFAIRLGRPKNGTFLMRRIGVISFSLVMPAGLDPTNAPWVAYPENLLDTPEMQALLEVCPTRGFRLETSDLEVIRQYLRTGTAVGVLPDFMLKELTDIPGIDIIKLNVGREIWLLTQAHLRNDPLARRISDWCGELFA